MKKLGKVLMIFLAAISVAACGKKEDKVSLEESSVSKKANCTKQDDKTYRCTVFSDGVNDDNLATKKEDIAILGAQIFIDTEKEVITEVRITINKESDEYGKALLEGTLRVPDAQTFYNKYVKIGTEGLSFKDVEKLKYTTAEDIKAVCNRETAGAGEACGAGGKSIYKPADLETGATGTAAAYTNILKAAIEEYKNMTK